MSENVMYGYARVSCRDQNEERQLIALYEFGVEKSRVYVDKQSGRDFARPAYKTLMGRLQPGDVLVIKSIDRLGRNYEEILEQWRWITKEHSVNIVILDMPLLDTRQGRDLTGTLIADIVLQLLSYVAQTEREFIRQRQTEGILAAKARGVHFGRRPLLLPQEFHEVYRRWENGELSSRKAGASLNVSQNTFLKWVREEKNKCCNEKLLIQVPRLS